MAAHYTLILGSKNLSSWSLRPYLAMRAAAVPFEEIVIRLDRPDSKAQILRHSAAGRVPVLKIAENARSLTIWDSLAICETLAERHPAATLWPEDADGRALARSYVSEMHSGFPELRQTLPMDFARVHPTPELTADVKGQIARIIEAWTSALSRAGAGGFLFGRFSIADCMYAPVVSRFRTYAIELPPPAKAYAERMMALPAMQDWARAAEAEVDAELA